MYLLHLPFTIYIYIYIYMLQSRKLLSTYRKDVEKVVSFKGRRRLTLLKKIKGSIRYLDFETRKHV